LLRMPGWARCRRLLRTGLFLLLALGAASALVEHMLERRDAARLTATETFYTVDGRRIRYRQTGRSAPGPTLVLLNGIAGSLEQWDKVQGALSATSPTLSFDRGGAGFSDPAEAHDAYADATELDRLLHAPPIARPPYVLIAFSSSAVMAIVYAARHPDVVQGIVFVDPILGARDFESYRRIFWRPSLVNPVEAFFGYTRLKYVIAARNGPPSTPESQRWNAIVESAHHWVATARDALSLDESAHEADALMATRPFAELPIGMLVTDPPHGGFEEAQRDLSKSSDRIIIRAVRYVHSELLENPGAVAATVDLIRTIAAERRPEAAVVSSGSP
jgi:pimeloyl-ACP methyl ester carboxylesterase